MYAAFHYSFRKMKLLGLTVFLGVAVGLSQCLFIPFDLPMLSPISILVGSPATAFTLSNVAFATGKST